jgi:hypothetical protein
MITPIPPAENPNPPKLSGGRKHSLRNGDTFRGEVVRDLGKGEVFIQVGGKPFRAVVTVPVKEGEVHEFRVKTAASKGGLPVLEFAPNKVPPQDSPLQRLGGISSILQDLTSSTSDKNLSPRTSVLLRDLSRALQGFAYRQGAGDTERWISRSMIEGGMFWENKVARYLLQGQGSTRGGWRGKLGNDLKGMLLELRESLKQERRDTPEVDPLSRRVEQAIELIQRVQLENQTPPAEEGGWTFLLPGRAEEGFSDVELHVRRNRKKKGETRFSLLMEFSSLGPVGVNCSVLDPSISVSFQVRDEATAEWVRLNLPSLEQALREKGLMPGHLVCMAGGTASVENGLGFSGGKHPDSVNLVI